MQIDKDGANPERVKQEMSEAGLLPEEWGGKTPFMQVCALCLLWSPANACHAGSFSFIGHVLHCNTQKSCWTEAVNAKVTLAFKLATTMSQLLHTEALINRRIERHKDTLELKGLTGML